MTSLPCAVSTRTSWPFFSWTRSVPLPWRSNSASESGSKVTLPVVWIWTWLAPFWKFQFESDDAVGGAGVGVAGGAGGEAMATGNRSESSFMVIFLEDSEDSHSHPRWNEGANPRWSV